MSTALAPKIRDFRHTDAWVGALLFVVGVGAVALAGASLIGYHHGPAVLRISDRPVLQYDIAWIVGLYGLALALYAMRARGLAHFSAAVGAAIGLLGVIAFVFPASLRNPCSATRGSSRRLRADWRGERAVALILAPLFLRAAPYRSPARYALAALCRLRRRSRCSTRSARERSLPAARNRCSGGRVREHADAVAARVTCSRRAGRPPGRARRAVARHVDHRIRRDRLRSAVWRAALAGSALQQARRWSPPRPPSRPGAWRSHDALHRSSERSS